MTTTSAGTATRAPYTLTSAIASRSIEVLTMPGLTPIVYVVDDDVSVRESLELLIKNAGWKPELFASAQDFLSRPRVAVPSCLVLDVSLPGLDGLELQQRLADRTDMPGIAMSRIRQLVSPTTSEARNASADENAWESKPNCRSKSGSDSRTDSSSSTTDTSERLAITSPSSRGPLRHALRSAGNGE